MKYTNSIAVFSQLLKYIRMKRHVTMQRAEEDCGMLIVTCKICYYLLKNCSEKNIFVTKIDEKCMLFQFCENLCSKAGIKIDEETSFSLLEKLLGLFVRVR